MSLLNNFKLQFILVKLVLVVAVIGEAVLYIIVGFITWEHIVFFAGAAVRLILLVIELLVMNEYIYLVLDTVTVFSLFKALGVKPAVVNELFNPLPKLNLLPIYAPVKHVKVKIPFNSDPATWNKSQLICWLTYLGLEETYEKLEKYKITGAQLLHLKQQDIKLMKFQHHVHVTSLATAVSLLNIYKSEYMNAQSPYSAGIKEVCAWLKHTISCPQLYLANFKKYGIHGGMLVKVTDNFLQHYIEIKDLNLIHSIMCAVRKLNTIETNVLDVAGFTYDTKELPLFMWPVTTVQQMCIHTAHLEKYAPIVVNKYICGAVLIDAFEHNTLAKLFDVTDRRAAMKLKVLLEKAIGVSNFSGVHELLSRNYQIALHKSLKSPNDIKMETMKPQIQADVPRIESLAINPDSLVLPQIVPSMQPSIDIQLNNPVPAQNPEFTPPPSHNPELNNQRSRTSSVRGSVANPANNDKMQHASVQPTAPSAPLDMNAIVINAASAPPVAPSFNPRVSMPAISPQSMTVVQPNQAKPKNVNLIASAPAIQSSLISPRASFAATNSSPIPVNARLSLPPSNAPHARRPGTNSSNPSNK